MVHWEKRIWDWGPHPVREEEMGDFKLSQNAAEVLRRKHGNPFLVVADQSLLPIGYRFFAVSLKLTQFALLTAILSPADEPRLK